MPDRVSKSRRLGDVDRSWKIDQIICASDDLQGRPGCARLKTFNIALTLNRNFRTTSAQSSEDPRLGACGQRLSGLRLSGSCTHQASNLRIEEAHGRRTG